MSIATKTGDSGTTGRLYGSRVSKTSPHITSVGDIDELNAAMGSARAHMSSSIYASTIQHIQKSLTLLMGEVVAEPEKRKEYYTKFNSLDDYDLIRLEDELASLEKDPRTKQKDWVLYGNSIIGANCDFAAKVCRRAERSLLLVKEYEDTLTLSTEESLRPLLFKYINRLSDFLHVLARYFDSL
jgi:cob(I)alamin adenosyltransferase